MADIVPWFVLLAVLIIATASHGCERIDPRDVLADVDGFTLLKRRPAVSPWEGESLEIRETMYWQQIEPSDDGKFYRCIGEDGTRSFLIPGWMTDGTFPSARD